MSVIVLGAVRCARIQLSTDFVSQGEIDLAINCSLKVLKEAKTNRRIIAS